MNTPSLRSLLLPSALLLAACTSDPTQVFVRIDVEPEVDARIVTLEVAVWGGPAGGALEEREIILVDAVDYPWPATLGVVPEGGDASRQVEVHVQALDGDDAVIAEVRGTTNFVPSETRLLDLVLEDACLGTTCSVDETCEAGTCLDSFIDPGDLPPYVCPLVCGALCVDAPETDPAHCGACDNVCDLNQDCVDGACVEIRCELLCDGDCVEDPATDPRHCGTCDNACPAGDRCVAGRCAAEGVAFEPSSDTILEPGDHTFSRVHVREGVTVTTTGTGELRIVSEGDVLIEGRFDLSGGNGGAGADVDGVGTGAGDGGATGRPTPGQTSDACGTGGNGGTGGDGLLGSKAPITGQCDPTPARFGGGPGAVLGSSGSGGGGYAGGGGGGGANRGMGGAGASFGAAVGGAGGRGGRNGTLGDDIATGGRGGVAPAPYGGGDGASMDATGCTSGPSPAWEGAGGGGGSIGADAAEDPGVFSTFRAGSGGGGGGAAATNGARTPGGGGGGGGGGAIRIESATAIRIPASGSILADGGDGGSVDVGEPSGAGGGGSGGAIVLQAPEVDVRGRLSARGGAGGTNMCGADGGAGGLGRVRISVGGDCALSGTFDPPLSDGCSVSATPGRVFIADL